jgi:hypothetical protein
MVLPSTARSRRRHYLVQDTGAERLMMELRLTRKGTQPAVPAKP